MHPPPTEEAIKEVHGNIINGREVPAPSGGAAAGPAAAPAAAPAAMEEYVDADTLAAMDALPPDEREEMLQALRMSGLLPPGVAATPAPAGGGGGSSETPAASATPAAPPPVRPEKTEN